MRKLPAVQPFEARESSFLVGNKQEGINITANRKGLKPWTEVVTGFQGGGNLIPALIAYEITVPISWIMFVTGFRGGTQRNTKGFGLGSPENISNDTFDDNRQSVGVLETNTQELLPLATFGAHADPSMINAKGGKIFHPFSRLDKFDLSGTCTGLATLFYRCVLGRHATVSVMDVRANGSCGWAESVTCFRGGGQSDCIATIVAFWYNEKFPVEPSTLVVLNSLIDMYGKLGEVEYALGVFSSMKEVDVISWNSLILGCCSSGVDEFALRLFCLMRCSGFIPGEFTVSTKFSACCTLRNLEKGKQILCICMKMGFFTNTIVSSAAIDCFSKCNRIGDSMHIFDESHFWDSLLCNSMTPTYARHGLAEKIFELFVLALDLTLMTGNTSESVGQQPLDESPETCVWELAAMNSLTVDEIPTSSVGNLPVVGPSVIPWDKGVPTFKGAIMMKIWSTVSVICCLLHFQPDCIHDDTEMLLVEWNALFCYPLELATPLLCDGITVYSPLLRQGMNQLGKSLSLTITVLVLSPFLSVLMIPDLLFVVLVARSDFCPAKELFELVYASDQAVYSIPQRLDDRCCPLLRLEMHQPGRLLPILCIVLPGNALWLPMEIGAKETWTVGGTTFTSMLDIFVHNLVDYSLEDKTDFRRGDLLCTGVIRYSG